MFTNNAFAAAAQSLPAGFLQWYLVVMVVAVVAGVLFDMAHKGSAQYFFANMRKSKGKGRQVGHNVSHANNRTKRRWYPNLQTVRVLVEGAPKRVRVCTQCLKSNRIAKAPKTAAAAV